MFACRANRVFEFQNLLRDVRAFPLTTKTGGGRKVSGAEPHQFNTIDLTHHRHLSHGLNRFDNRHDKHMIVGFCGVFDNALSPARCAFSADASQTFRRIPSKRHRLFELFCRLNPRDHNPIGSDVERTFDQSTVEFRNSHQRHRVTPHCRADVFSDFFPVEVPVLRIDHHPIEPQSDRHFRDAGGFERHPESKHRFIASQLLSQTANSGRFHGRPW